MDGDFLLLELKELIKDTSYAEGNPHVGNH